MVWLLVLTFMVGKIGADDVVSFEDGFASNRRLVGYDPNDLVTMQHTLHTATPEHATANPIAAGSMSDMTNFCTNFVAHIDTAIGGAGAWRNVGEGYGDGATPGRTAGSSLNTGHTYGSGGAFGLGWNQDGYYADGHAQVGHVVTGDVSSQNSATHYDPSAKHTAYHFSTDSVGIESRKQYGEDTTAISSTMTEKSTPVNEYRNDGEGRVFPARRLSTQYWPTQPSLDIPTGRSDEGLKNGPGGEINSTFYNPEINRLVNEKTILAGMDVNYKEEIEERCKGFLQKLEDASKTALSSVRQWMSETEKIRDIARSNCLAGQHRQDAHKKLRQDAIDDVDTAITNMNNAMDTLRTKQLDWCKARDLEMTTLRTEYHALAAEIESDIKNPEFYSATNTDLAASTNLVDWDYKNDANDGFAQINNDHNFQDPQNQDVFGAPVTTVTLADGTEKNTRSTFSKTFNSVEGSDAASHMKKRKAEINAAWSAVHNMVTGGKDAGFGSLDTFYVDPTKRSWNILCDVLKVCKGTTDIAKVVKVSRGAGLAVNGQAGVKAGAVNDIDNYNQCTDASSTGCLHGYLTSYCKAGSLSDETVLGTCTEHSDASVLHGPNEPSTWGKDNTCTWSIGDCDVHQDVPCQSIEGAIDAGGYDAGDSAVRQAVEEAVCGEGDDLRAHCGMTSETNVGYAKKCDDNFPSTRREKVVKHCSTWTDSVIRTKRLQYAKLEATTEHIISASADSYLTYFRQSKAKMKTIRDAEYVALEAMRVAQATYIDAYLAHAEALRKANEENQFFMEMVMEAEMMRLAYDQFQHTVTTAQVAAQMTYTKDEKALYQAHQVGAELGATCPLGGDPTNLCVNVPGKPNPRTILQKSAMYSTTNKWFGLAQQNLEALIDDSEVVSACCGGSWDSCPAPSCAELHTSATTEFQPSQESIPARQCVCTLLKDAVGQARRVQAERRAAIQLLKYMSYNLKNISAVADFCTAADWCHDVL